MAFDTRRMARKIEDQLAGNVVGYQFAIYAGDALSASGSGGAAVLSPLKPMTADHRLTTASMTKTITAVALMRALEVVNAEGADYTQSPQGLSVESPIAPWLPRWWARGPHVGEMSFRHLLTHTSGLRTAVPGENEDLYESLRLTIAAGSTDDNWQKEVYDNNNFSLLRVIIPYLLYGATLDGANLPAGESAGRYTARLYYNFVRDQVLGRVGLQNVSLCPQGPHETNAYYDLVDKSSIMDPSFDWHLLRVGSGHWFMSSRELAKFIAGLRYGRVVSLASVQQMMDLGLGMYRLSDSTTGGANWNHNGGFGADRTDGTTVGGEGMEGNWVILPDDVTAVCMVNSAGHPKNLYDVICDAFNAARLRPAVMHSRPSAAPFATRLHVFIRANDGRVYGNAAREGQPFGGWYQVEGRSLTTPHSPAVAALGNRLYVAITANGQVLINSALDGRPFDGFGTMWTPIPGVSTAAAPAAAALGNRLYVFARSADSRIRVASASAGGAFGAWSEVQGGFATDQPVAAASLAGRLYVVARGPRDGHAYLTSAADGQPFDGFGRGWTALPGVRTDAAPALAAVASRLYVFVKALDGRLHAASAAAGQAFGAWAQVQGGFITDAAPGASSLGGRIYLFARQAGTGRLFVTSAASGGAFDGFGAGWSEVHW
ncbi:MAG: serine hydrolase [Vicinamibacterales bacterium]